MVVMTGKWIVECVSKCCLLEGSIAEEPGLAEVTTQWWDLGGCGSHWGCGKAPHTETVR